RPYLAMLSAHGRTLLQYRAAALAGFTTQLFWGGIRMMVFYALYENAPADLTLGYPQVVAYIWLGQAFLGLFPIRINREVTELIRSGNVAYELLRPVDLYAFWFARTAAERIAPTAMRAAPMLVLAALAGWLAWPGWGRLGAFAVLMAGAVAVSTAFTMLMNISLFWTLSGRGINIVMSTLTFLLSGMLCPLPFFPAWAQPLLEALPLRALADVPFRLFAGDLPLAALPRLVLFILGWVAAMILAGRWLMGRAMGRLVVQGG
ncbi:MAG: ABC transporter permease, partial [Planctomycetes bacterium]|nr:ABC transporter permease [Planctomycetota bacterium]